jgi:hypothetical protein
MRRGFLLTLAGAILYSQQAVNNYFRGTVIALEDEVIAIAGDEKVDGKQEVRVFQLTPATKIEGKLTLRSHVNLRFSPDEDGEDATLIVVEPAADEKKTSPAKE